MFLLFISSLFPREFKNTTTKTIIIIGTLFSAFVVVTNPELFTKTLIIYQIFTLLVCVYTLILMSFVIIRKREGSIIFLTGIIVLFITVINDILYATRVLDTGFYISVGMLGFLFSQAYLLSVRYSKTFLKISRLSNELQIKSDSLEKLNINLEENVMERTKEIDASMRILELMNDDLLSTNKELQETHKELQERSTKLEEAMKAYKESEEKYRNILESIEEGYYEVDLNGNIIFFNDSLINMLQYNEKEFIGLSYKSVMDEGNINKIFNIFNTVYKTGNSSNIFDVKVTRKDKTEFFCEVSTSLIQDSEDNPVGFRGIFRDINEKKMAEEALKKSEEQLQKVLTGIREDLNLAKNIQENILPKNIDNIGSLSFHIKYHPLIEIGGDIYDIYETENGIVRIFLADATGHGIVAALVTMLIKSEYEQLKIREDSPSKIIESLNKIFLEKYKSLNIFFTGIIIDIDENDNSLTYSSAGHPSQILIRGKNIINLHKTGRAIGFVKDIKCITKQHKFNEKEKLLLFTDGLTEEFNQSYEEFGEERIHEIILNNPDKNLDALINDLMIQVTDYISGLNFNDDITIIGIER